MAKILRAVLLLVALALLAGVPAVASADTENGSGDLRFTAQQAAPSVSLTAAGGVQVRLNSPVSVTATFSEPVSGFTLDDVSVMNGTASGFSGSDGDAVYTFDVTPGSLAEVTVDVAAGVATDGDGDGNTAASQLSLGIPYDFDGSGGIGKPEAIAAIRDYFANKITKAQAIAVIRLYFATPAEPEPMVMQSFAPGEEVKVEHPSGAMIEVPQEATAGPEEEQFTVSIEEVESPEGSIIPGGRVFDFNVLDQDGREVDLREPVRLSLPYDEGLDPADVAVLGWNDALGRWDAIEVVEVDESTNTVVVEGEDLSHKKTASYMEPMFFIATTALSLLGKGMKAHYEAGFKHLVSFYAQVGLPLPFLPVFEVGEVGLSLVLDVDDLASLPGIAPLLFHETLQPERQSRRSRRRARPGTSPSGSTAAPRSPLRRTSALLWESRSPCLTPAGTRAAAIRGSRRRLRR